MSTFDTIKRAKQPIRDTVFGFVRGCQCLLGDNKIIAPLIYHLCLLYFYIQIEIESKILDTVHQKKNN